MARSMLSGILMIKEGEEMSFAMPRRSRLHGYWDAGACSAPCHWVMGKYIQFRVQQLSPPTALTVSTVL